MGWEHMASIAGKVLGWREQVGQGELAGPCHCHQFGVQPLPGRVFTAVSTGEITGGSMPVGFC